MGSLGTQRLIPLWIPTYSSYLAVTWVHQQMLCMFCMYVMYVTVTPISVSQCADDLLQSPLCWEKTRMPTGSYAQMSVMCYHEALRPREFKFYISVMPQKGLILFNPEIKLRTKQAWWHLGGCSRNTNRQEFKANLNYTDMVNPR